MKGKTGGIPVTESTLQRYQGVIQERDDEDQSDEEERHLDLPSSKRQYRPENNSNSFNPSQVGRSTDKGQSMFLEESSADIFKRLKRDREVSKEGESSRTPIETSRSLYSKFNDSGNNTHKFSEESSVEITKGKKQAERPQSKHSDTSAGPSLQLMESSISLLKLSESNDEDQSILPSVGNKRLYKYLP